ARAPDDLLSVKPVGRALVLLDRKGIAPQPDDKLPGLTRKHRRREERGEEEAARRTAHVCFLVKGMEIRVVSQSICTIPPFPWGMTAIVNCSTGCGKDSVCTSTRTRSESAA